MSAEEWKARATSALRTVEQQAQEIRRLREALNFAAAALVETCDESKNEALRHIAKLDSSVQKIDPPNERQSDD